MTEVNTKEQTQTESKYQKQPAFSYQHSSSHDDSNPYDQHPIDC